MSGGNPLENELNTYRTIQKEIGKVQNQISTAQTQILENEMVLKVRPLFGGTRLSTLARACGAGERHCAAVGRAE